MKLSAVAILAVIGSTSAARPSLTINVQDGNFADIGGLDPSLSWSASTSSGDVDIEYGIEASAKPTSDIASLPKSIWGKASTSLNGWGVSARAEFEGTDFTHADVEVEASNAEADIDVTLTASAGDGFAVQTISAVKGIDSDGARITVNPRYNVETEESDVVLTYSKDGTDVEVTASQDAQSVTLSRQVDDDNRVAPTLASSGDISVAWERSLGDDNSITTTVKPDDSIDVEWKDAAWTANINLPLDGTDITGTNVSIKREVEF
eukprot:CAMPEP_0197245748 /NCGR_PEP_ID=MMETSP1429-20130617/10429_1 /TAXON_ID=49237 /ORGANISM="Chaetoceros  sp., Strain UNC1202" /LENGTH=263 /DNA_ID=CAMNT_0042706297 /DNA_START=38 /DNA_END=829 /DNA_ORIENTATION=-